MATPIVNFRLSEAYQAQLDAICADWGVSRADAIRKLIHEQSDRRALGDRAAEQFIGRLVSAFEPEAELQIDMRGADVDLNADAVRLGGQPLGGAKVIVLDRLNGKIALVLDDAGGPASLVLAELHPPSEGVEWTFRLPLGALNPEMYET